MENGNEPPGILYTCARCGWSTPEEIRLYNHQNLMPPCRPAPGAAVPVPSKGTPVSKEAADELLDFALDTVLQHCAPNRPAEPGLYRDLFDSLCECICRFRLRLDTTPLTEENLAPILAAGRMLGSRWPGPSEDVEPVVPPDLDDSLDFSKLHRKHQEGRNKAPEGGAAAPPEN